MIKFFNPSYLFSFLNKSINIINVIILPFLIVALIFALIVSPQDYIQGNSVRIMYVHVPAAWIGLMCFSVISFLSILSFLFKLKNLVLFYKSLAPIGLSFTLIAIITGSLWGQPTWGTYWVWDARLTSMLILMFVYLIFIFSYKFFNQEIASKICVGISILGMVNLFIIKYSVDLWSTLHQTASIKITGSTSIDSSMLLPLSMMLLVFFLYCALIFLMKYKSEVIRMKNKSIKRL